MSCRLPESRLSQLHSGAGQEKVVTFIEGTLSQILQQIQIRPLGRPMILLKHITGIQLHRDPATGRIDREILDREVTYTWPGQSRDEAWRFTCVGKILTDIYMAIKTNETVTKRDIFYRDPCLYRRQITVDRYVDDIAHTCCVTRKDLHVTASTKGLVAGLTAPRLEQNLQHDIRKDIEKIPDATSELHDLSLHHIRWILVVEKEATFHGLAQKGLHRQLAAGPGLLVTGKGYPDLATRRFLRAVLDHPSWNQRPAPPILGLFDCDPDGIEILRTYQYGSISLAHENACNLPEMMWLGVNLTDIVADSKEDEALLRLTLRDRRKAQAMLERQQIYAEDVVEGRCFRELQKMLSLGVKAEIQVLQQRSEGLEAWVASKISRTMSL